MAFGLFRSLSFIATSIVLCGACAQTGDVSKAIEKSQDHSFQVEELTSQKDVIWGFDFVDQNQLIFTEKSGRVRLLNLKDNSVTEISGAPKIAFHGQGGLLDIRLHPTDKSQVYMTYAKSLGEGYSTALARAKLTKNNLSELKELFVAQQSQSGGQHFGSRIEFDGEGHIYISLGDRGERQLAQSLENHMGSIVRLNEDGSVPDDNPFSENKKARPELWTIGHRNPQGLVRHFETGELWSAEMGPRGGDEINRIQRGKNYGWPVVTLGREYYGPKIGTDSKEGMVDPVVNWTPSVSPSAITVYSGDRFSKWKGNFFLGTLSGQHLRRVVLENNKLVKQESLLKDKGWRIRNVRTGPEGYLYLSTDNGVIARLIPVEKAAQ